MKVRGKKDSRYEERNVEKRVHEDRNASRMDILLSPFLPSIQWDSETKLSVVCTPSIHRRKCFNEVQKGSPYFNQTYEVLPDVTLPV